MDREIQRRLQWVQLYQETGDAGLVCRRCGISRPTLRKWWKRYQQDGESGLVNQSRRPHHSPNTKVGQQEEQLILNLRKTRNLGARRIQSELKRLHEIFLSLATVHKVLQKHVSNRLKSASGKPITFGMPVPYRVSGFRWTPAKSLLAGISTPL